MPTPVEAHNPFDSRRKPPSTPSTTPVLLHTWWLVKADSGRLGVEGFNYPPHLLGDWYMRAVMLDGKISLSLNNHRTRPMRCFSSGPIVKRRDAVTLETVDGRTVLLHGHLNRSRTLQNGFSKEVCDDFLIGFPYYWEEFAGTSVSEEPSIFSVPEGTYSSDTGDDRNVFINAMQTDESEVSDAYKTPDRGDHRNVFVNAMQTDEGEVSDAYKTPDPQDYMNDSDNAMQTNDDDASVSDNILQTDTNENMVTTPDKTPLSSKKVKPEQKKKKKKKSGNSVEDVVLSGPLTRSRTRMLMTRSRTSMLKQFS